MEKRESNIRDFIIIGGCHVAGFGAEGNPSFVDIIESKLGSKCMLRKNLFQLKNVSELTIMLDSFHTDLVILQVGNYEFNASLKGFLFLPKKTKQSTSSTLIEDPFSEGHSWIYTFAVTLFKYILIPAIWMYVKYKNGKYLLILKKIISKNLDRTFVIISPLPCYKSPNSIIRRMAKVYFGRMLNLSNVVIFDSFEQFPKDKTMFFNRQHLSAKGHKHLGIAISETILTNILN